MASFPDPESFRPFVEEHFAGVASFAWSVLGSGFEAEDVAQEAFVLVYGRRQDAWFRSLSKRQRAIAHLHFGQDRDPGEIAAALGISPVTVRVQLARIRTRIQTASGAPRRCSDASG